LVAFLDADDYWHPEKIEAQVGALTRDPSAGAAITLLEHFWMPNMTFEENDPSFARFKKPMLGYQLSCVMARRDTFDRVGGFDSRRSEETDWFLRLRHAQIPVAVVDRVLTFRRFHDANISRPKGQRNDDPLLMTLKNEIDRRRKSAIDRNRNTDE
jgi:GT2 family glycosyltransferase